MYNLNYASTTLGVQSWKENISWGTRTRKLYVTVLTFLWVIYRILCTCLASFQLALSLCLTPANITQPSWLVTFAVVTTFIQFLPHHQGLFPSQWYCRTLSAWPSLCILMGTSKMKVEWTVPISLICKSTCEVQTISKPTWHPEWGPGTADTEVVT
jgi:hypothetical protein